MQGVGRTRILLVGSRILPFRHSGDKNFWLDIIRGVQRLGHGLEVITVMLDHVDSNGWPFHRIEPIPVYLRPDLRFNPGFRHVAGTNNYASKTLTLPRVINEVRSQLRTFRPDVIHFAENYGPAAAALRAAIGPTPMAISAPTYQPDRPFYDVFLRASFSSFNVVVPFSDAYSRRLLDLGLPLTRIRRIRWGIDVAKFVPPSDAEREAARQELGIPKGSIVVQWTGFLQQAKEPDLDLALRTARRALESDGSKFAFFFSFKPEHFKEAYRRFEHPGLRVTDSGALFHTVRNAADVLLSPINDLRSTAAPPLAWLESLAMGIPILSTDVPGAREAVVDGQSGFVGATPKEIAARLHEMFADSGLVSRLKEGARRIAVERYSLDRSLQEYVDLWAAMARLGPAS
jgi:glycosyltransferase involved in cell wall biosynthesis